MADGGMAGSNYVKQTQQELEAQRGSYINQGYLRESWRYYSISQEDNA
jgi:hypothetical protein